MDKKISLIIPCYNTADTLMRAWESVKNQTMDLRDLECVFIDDASTDNNETWSLIQSIEREAPDSVIAVRLPENRRQGGARNAGLTYASGSYLMFFDADDALLPHACSLLYQLAEQYETDLITYKHLNIHTPEADTAYPDPVLYFITNEDERKPFLVPGRVSYGCCGKFYRMALIRKTGSAFAEHHLLYEEPPFVYPLFFHAGRILMMEHPMFTTFGRPDSATCTAKPEMIPEHTVCQLAVLSYFTDYPDLLNTYRNEIAFYFLWSFFYETVVFARLSRYRLPDDVLAGMRETCRRTFPDWRNNPYMRTLNPDEQRVMDMIDGCNP